MDRNNAKSSGKKVHIEFLRIFACFMVFYNHTDAAIRNVAIDELSKSRVSAILFFMLCKTAVPIFLMIAGANLMRKHDSIKKSLMRIGKVVLLIILASFFYHLYYYRSFDLSVFVNELISGKTTIAIWYLYIYLGIMVILPILQKLSLSRNLYIYLFTLHLLGPALVPFLEYYLDITFFPPYLLMIEVSSYIIIFLLGDFLEYEIDGGEIKSRNLLRAIAIGVCAWGISFLFAIYKMQLHNEEFDDKLYNQIYYTPTILLACSVFIACKCLFDKIHNEKLCLLITKIGSYTLGIYIMGDYLRLQLEFVLDFLKSHMSEFIAVLLFDLVILITGILIMWGWEQVKRIVKVMVCK